MQIKISKTLTSWNALKKMLHLVTKYRSERAFARVPITRQNKMTEIPMKKQMFWSLKPLELGVWQRVQPKIFALVFSTISKKMAYFCHTRSFCGPHHCKSAPVYFWMHFAKEKMVSIFQRFAQKQHCVLPTYIFNQMLPPRK